MVVGVIATLGIPLELFPRGSVELPDPAMAQEFFQGTLTMTVENEGDGLNFLFRAD